jgi:RES domain-containing protein
MIVYRLSQKEFANQLNGEGARKYGGRWNNKGTNIMYTGETRALCSTEVAVHSQLGMVPQNYVMVSILIPDNILIETIDLNTLPNGWNKYPWQNATQAIGDSFIKKLKHLVLKVPSATIDGEHNFLLNPFHPQMAEVKIIDIKPFNFDSRLFVR